MRYWGAAPLRLQVARLAKPAEQPAHDTRACGLQKSWQRASNEQQSEQIGPENAGQWAISSASK